MRPQQSRVVRMRKLSPKTLQEILREEEIDAIEYESLQGQYKVETGVEKSEESEYHLQAALATSGEKEANEIPAPLATAGDFDYDALYTASFQTPSTYIRSSQTVEECTGCQYNMSSEDDDFLRDFNDKRNASSRCSEDDFELIMDVFEETAELQAPFASVDNTVVTFESMRSALAAQISVEARAFAMPIYEYWKAQRQASSNHGLQPSLKFETHQENDDQDPYVCFRRREVRVQRKTRARDMHSTEKLKRLRKELEEGRELVKMALERETLRFSLLQTEANIFETRANVKSQKIRLGIKGDDEDLVNQKPPKRQRTEGSQMQRQSGSGQQIRLPARPDGRPLDADLIHLSDIVCQKEDLLKAEIEEKARQHRKWNHNHVDLTKEPLSPVQGRGRETSFRPATTQFQLLTPPSSVTSESFDMASPSHEKRDEQQDTVSFRYVTPPKDDEESRSQPAYRRRIGRNGRLWIDRRGMSSGPKPSGTNNSDQWKYDDDDDDDEQPIYEFDPYDAYAIKFRASIPVALSLTQRARVEGTRPSAVSPTAARTVAGPQQAASDPTNPT